MLTRRDAGSVSLRNANNLNKLLAEIDDILFNKRDYKNILEYLPSELQSESKATHFLKDYRQRLGTYYKEDVLVNSVSRDGPT